MANPEHLAILKQGVDAWNHWRGENPIVKPDLSRAKLGAMDLRGANLGSANLRETDLSGTNLLGAKLSWAELCHAHLWRTGLYRADLCGTDLNDTNLEMVDLCEATLRRASLNGAILSMTMLHKTEMTEASLGFTVFSNVDLSSVKGLESIRHQLPSTLGIDTIYKSQGKIPEIFLRGCGVPEELIAYIPSLIGAMEPIQYNSCFISYSSKDDEFARRLYDAMRGKHLRVWFAPEDMQGGRKIIEQIELAIQVNDRLLLVLSEESMNSEWVKTEIRRARKVELRDKRQKLFPIRLVSVDRIREWECFDADTGKDLAVEIREYHIPDFSNWKDHDAFEAAFADLLRDLRAQAR